MRVTVTPGGARSRPKAHLSEARDWGKRATIYEAEALVDGIAGRRATVIEPRRWRIPYYLRGLLMPLTDRRLEENLKARAMIRQIEDRDLTAEGTERG